MQQNTLQFKRCARTWNSRCEKRTTFCNENLLRVGSDRGSARFAQKHEKSKWWAIFQEAWNARVCLATEIFWPRMRLQEVGTTTQKLERSEGLRGEVQLSSRLDILTFGRQKIYRHRNVYSSRMFFDFSSKKIRNAFLPHTSNGLLLPETYLIFPCFISDDKLFLEISSSLHIKVLFLKNNTFSNLTPNFNSAPRLNRVHENWAIILGTENLLLPVVGFDCGPARIAQKHKSFLPELFDAWRLHKTLL